MKKIFIAISIILVLSFPISTQTAKGKEIRNRDVVWSDFTGPVDRTSERFAYTYWITTYSFSPPAFNGNKARVQVAVRLFLDPISWVKQDKRSARLLKHEQGHFRLGRICADEIEDTINSTDFSRNNYQKEIDALYWKIIDKYRALNKQYDLDTNHFRNLKQQAIWDKKLDDLLNDDDTSMP